MRVLCARSIELSIKTAGGLCTCCCGGEGFFNTVLTGPGLVYVQSMSFQKFKKSMQIAVQQNQGGAGGGGPPESEAMDR